MPEATTSSCFVVLPAGLILLDKGENALFEIDAELGHSLSWAAPVRGPGRYQARPAAARDLRQVPAGGGLRGGRLQARSHDGGPSRGGGAEQRGGHPAAGRGGYLVPDADLRAHLHRQGGQPQQRDGVAKREGGRAVHPGAQRRSLAWGDDVLCRPVRQRPGLQWAAEQSARVNALILRELNVSQAELDALWTFVKTKRLRQRARLWRAKCGSGSVWPPRFG